MRLAQADGSLSGQKEKAGNKQNSGSCTTAAASVMACGHVPCELPERPREGGGGSGMKDFLAMMLGGA